MKTLNKNRISIAFVVKGNKKIGYGHLKRCRALAEKFQQMANCSIKFLSKAPLSSNFDILITDLLDINEKQLKRLKKKAKLLVSIDDGHKVKFPSDILVEPSINPKCRFRKKTKYLSGKNYVILGKEFEKYNRAKKISKEPKLIFVCFGGSDSNNLTEKIIRILKEIDFEKRIKINTVLGPLFGSSKKVEKLAESNEQYVFLKNVLNSAKILRKADLAIISGGTLMYEACSLGIPAIIICQNQEQNIEAEFCGKKGAIINFGIFNKLDDEKLKNTIFQLLEDLNLRKKLSTDAQRLINPYGTKRIASLILKELNKRK